ncbi:MAG: hypothetical protein NW703_05445 [Nitrospiraceae bacterium]
MGKLVRVVIQLPIELKNQLDLLKQQGYTASGFIRAVLEREFAKVEEDKTDKPNHAVRSISPRSISG